MSGCSNGPVMTLPGHVSKSPEGMLCDSHYDGDDKRVAVKRIQGETDSWGAEYFDLCQECYTEYLNEKDKPEALQCEWCNSITNDCKPTRDMDEGLAGPVYNVCSKCRKKQNDRAREELEEYNDTDCTIDDDF